jgi:hypothetical protein
MLNADLPPTEQAKTTKGRRADDNAECPDRASSYSSPIASFSPSWRCSKDWGGRGTGRGAGVRGWGRVKGFVVTPGQSQLGPRALEGATCIDRSAQRSSSKAIARLV